MDLIAWAFAGAVMLTLIAVVAWGLASQKQPDERPAVADLDPLAPPQPITAAEVGVDLAADPDRTATVIVKAGAGA